MVTNYVRCVPVPGWLPLSCFNFEWWVEYEWLWDSLSQFVTKLV